MIVEYIAKKRNGKWVALSPRQTRFTEDTVPALNVWLKRGREDESSCFTLGEKPIPRLPAADAVLEEVTLTAEQLEKVKKAGCSTCGKKRETKLPDTQCWECAEKHFGTAYSLYTEIGYKAINKLHCIGELASAAKHIASAAPEFAAKLRTLRHDIQNGLDIPSTRWDELAEEFYTLKPKGK